MAQLYSLLVAICDYPNPAHRLEGCINDLNHMKAHLEEYCADNQLELNTEIQINEQASRENIIQGFKTFEKANKGDHCLFFFAGHGSQCRAPKEFWHMESDRLNETLVCWDSRTEGGRDLIDKELSYLIWKATYKKEVNFLSITDCCHSGSSMRFHPIKERRVSQFGTAPTIEEYLGFDQYKKEDENTYIPPQGIYIHLAAAQSHQTAKEVRSEDGEQRGVFTYMLLEVLKGAITPLSYNEIISRTRFRIQRYFHDQYPMLEASQEKDKNKIFLGSQTLQTKSDLLVSWNKTKGWVINAGRFQQIQGEEVDNPSIFQLLEGDHQVLAKKVYVDHSSISNMPDFNKDKIYPARLVSSGVPKIIIAFAPDSEEQGVSILDSQLSLKPSIFFTFSKSSKDAQFLIHAKNGAYYLSGPLDNKPLFKKIHGYKTENALKFIGEFEKVIHWQQILELSHSNSGISSENIKINLLRSKVSEDNMDFEMVNWQEPGLFKYGIEKGSFKNPTFRLSIKNTDFRPVWVSVLYLGVDYSISNILMASERLSAGKEAWCGFNQDGHFNKNIPIVVLDSLHKQGITKSTNYLKIIVSTSAFVTDQFNQTGIQLDTVRGSENRAAKKRARKQDWLIQTIPIAIYRPLFPTILTNQEPVELFGHQIKAPEGFSAEVHLETLEAASNHLTFSPGLPQKQGKPLIPFDLGPSEVQPELSVMVFSNCEGLENISKEQPLQINLRNEEESRGLEIYFFSLKDDGFIPVEGSYRQGIWQMDEGDVNTLEKEGGFRLFFFDQIQG